MSISGQKKMSVYFSIEPVDVGVFITKIKKSSSQIENRNNLLCCETIWTAKNKYKLPFPGGKVHFKLFYNRWDMPASQSTGVHER